MFTGEVTAQVQGTRIGGQQFLFAFELFGEEFFKHIHLNAQQLAEGTHINDIFEELPLARIGVHRVRNFSQRHADDVDIFTEFGRWHRLGAVVKQVATHVDFGHICVPGLRVHGDHHVDATAPAEVALFTYPGLVPGRQALDVAGEDVAWAHRHTHAQDGFGKQLVGRS